MGELRKGWQIKGTGFHFRGDENVLILIVVMHNSVIILKTVELFTSNGWVYTYVNYMSITLLQKIKKIPMPKSKFLNVKNKTKQKRWWNIFSDTQKLKEFIITISTLQEMLTSFSRKKIPDENLNPHQKVKSTINVYMWTNIKYISG